MGLFNGNIDGYYDVDLGVWIPAVRASARSLRRKKLKQLKLRMAAFSPADAKELEPILNCEDYEQRNAMIDEQREIIQAEIDIQYKIQKQYSTKSIEYQRARARYVELDKILDFLSDCRNI